MRKYARKSIKTLREYRCLMKILHFTDPHGNLNVMRKIQAQSADVDVVLMTGDLTLMGRDLRKLLTFLNTCVAPVLVIHGNHEDEDEMRTACSELDNVTFLHEQFVNVKGYWFGAYATSGLRENYPEQEAWVAEHADEIRAKKPLIWLDHAPPRDTKMDELAEDWHAGSVSLRAFIETFQPLYVFHGHFHETFGMEDMVDDTVIINSGPSGRVVELEDRS